MVKAWSGVTPSTSPRSLRRRHEDEISARVVLPRRHQVRPPARDRTRQTRCARARGGADPASDIGGTRARPTRETMLLVSVACAPSSSRTATAGTSRTLPCSTTLPEARSSRADCTGPITSTISMVRPCPVTRIATSTGACGVDSIRRPATRPPCIPSRVTATQDPVLPAGRRIVTVPGTRATRSTPSGTTIRSSYTPGSRRTVSPARAAPSAAAICGKAPGVAAPATSVRGSWTSGGATFHTSPRVANTPASAPRANQVVRLPTTHRAKAPICRSARRTGPAVGADCTSGHRCRVSVLIQRSGASAPAARTRVALARPRRAKSAPSAYTTVTLS